MTLSKIVQIDLLRKTIGLKKKMRVVHWGVDTTRFHPRSSEERKQLRKHLGLPMDTLVVGFIGRYDVWKGHVTFLEAAKRIAGCRADVLFLLVGGAITEETIPSVARYRQMVMEKISELNFDGRLMVWGHRDDVPEILASLDVFVCPSDIEPYGLVVLEALASGVPVVASRTVGALEVVGRKNGVFVADPKDPTSFSQRIIEALQYIKEHVANYTIQSAVGDSVATTLDDSWHQCARSYEELYESMRE